MMIGLVQPGTSRGTFLQRMGSRKMTPPRMLRIVPLGERYISTTGFFTAIFAMAAEPLPVSLRARMYAERGRNAPGAGALWRAPPPPARIKHEPNRTSERLTSLV